MSTDEHDWVPEHIAALGQTISEIWPNAPEAERELLASGIMHVVRRRKLKPAHVFTALVDLADSGRERLPSVGVLVGAIGRRRARLEGRQLTSEQRQIEPRIAGQPWAPALWTAAFVHAGGRDRAARIPADTILRLQPWLALVRSIGLRPAHGVDTSIEHDAQRVAQAHKLAADVWRQHGGISESAALKAMGAKR